jgi:hypothetical protein
VLLKSTEHRNIGIGLEEVDEEPIAMAMAQKQQWRVMARAQKKSGTFF